MCLLVLGMASSSSCLRDSSLELLFQEHEHAGTTRPMRTPIRKVRSVSVACEVLPATRVERIFRRVFASLESDADRCFFGNLQLGANRRTMLHILAGMQHDVSDVWRAEACQVLANYTSETVRDCIGRSAFDIGENSASKHVSAFFELRRLVLKRYKLEQQLHKSSTSMVFLALEMMDDEGAKHPSPVPVALKFMKHREQFRREIDGRAGLDEAQSEFVMPVIRSHADVNAERSELSFYPFCVVMPRGDRTLQDAMTHEHFTGKPEAAKIIKRIAHYIAEALRYLHIQG